MRKTFFFLSVLTSLCVTAQQTETIYLSGHGNDDTKTWDFTVSEGMHAGKRSKIQVPSCWEQQGFGDYTYGRWYTKKGEKPSAEEGHYSLQFDIPASWRDKQVDIVFEGVMTDASVSINGHSAGPMHQGGFTAFSYDITDKVRCGAKNRLDVTVQKESSDKSINAAERKADWWLFGGIYRPVYLTAKPKRNIECATIDARADGEVRVQLLTKGPHPDGSKEFLLLGIDGLGEHSAEIPADSCLLSFAFDSPKLWDPEHPNLYDLKLQLVSDNGKVQHEITKRIGFRTVELRRKDGFYLNGTKLLIKGVNRHCFYPETGRTTSKRQDLEDVKLIKGMNANAIRSHYPPDGHLLDICDSLGVLYLDELPGWQNAYSTGQGARILREMVTHDASHPCIFAWSNGNEGGFNLDLDPLFAQYDPQGRHVVHAWALWDGVDCHHYPAFQTGVSRLHHGQEVFMPTEFLHAQYDKGGGASLNDFWNSWRQTPMFAGGFIWAWADEGIARTDRGGEIDTDGPNGPDGIVGPQREKEGSWYAIREIWSPLQIEPVAVNKDWDGNIIIRNCHLYSNLNECSLSCGDKEVPLPAARPGEAVRVKLPFDSDEDILKLVALNAYNDTIFIRTWPIKSASEYFCAYPRTKSTKNITPEFDSNTGMLKKIMVDDREIPFNNGPRPVGFEMRLKRFKQSGNRFVAHYTGAVDSIVWEVHDNGMLSMEAVIFNDRHGHGHEGPFINENARIFGFTFDYPEEECTGMNWIGKGPYRVWRNRMEGQNFGVWHKDYNNTVTGEGVLVYPEFKGYHADVYRATIESESAPFTVHSETDGLFLRMFTPEEPLKRRDGKPTMEAFPEGEISFLIDIAPIQSYKPLEQLGPEAMRPTVRINPGDVGIRIKLWFEF